MTTYDEHLEQIKSTVMKDLKLRIWDMYSVEGFQPKLIKQAFNEVMEQIEEEEAKHE